MKKLMQSLRVALAFALVAAHLSVVPAFAETAKTSPLQSLTGGIHENLDFYGVIPCRISDSTTAVLCKSGEGFLDAVCADGGTGNLPYSLGLDSGIAGSRSVTNSDTLLLTPMVFSRFDSASTQGHYCWNAKADSGGPVRFVNGLVGVQNAASHSTILYWHYSDGSNP